MCFVTYLPYQEGFILTSNRDEHVGRPKASPPKKYYINGKTVFYPQDTLAGGTWIATSSNATLCLLNGAFQRHEHRPPYRQSRGLVVLDFFKYENLALFLNQYLWNGIEPFTLVIVEEKDEIRLTELRWDGQKMYVKELDSSQSHAWSSVTLYSDDVIQQREEWFEKWQRNNLFYTGEDIMQFHDLGGDGDITNDLVINRNDELKTVSTTQVQKTSEDFLIKYYDRLNEQEYKYRIFASENVC